MRPLARIVCTTAVVVATAACSGSAPSPTLPTSPTSPTSPASQDSQALFPLTISRIGGIAGFRDVLVVAEDGIVSVTRKGQRTRRCRLTPAALARLTTAASRVPWSRLTPATTSPSFPDDMVSTLQPPAGPPVRMEDPLAGSGRAVFAELLNDLTGGAKPSPMCPPV